MATMLDTYVDLQMNFEDQLANNALPLDKVMKYQELLYRISVLKSCQLFVKTAPITVDTQVLSEHYQMWEAYLYTMMTNHKVGEPADLKRAEQRKTAETSLGEVTQNLRKQFGSFQATTAEIYKQKITTLITTVLPVWIQYRETYVSLKEEK